MDYEKKYKEALVNMQELYNSMKYMSSTDALHTTTALERAFPELKESEDDGIREWLIGYFNQYIIDGMPQSFCNGLNVKDVIAWLEKQGDIDRRIQEEIEKQTKQQWKAEKQVEPKFKVGDWVVSSSGNVNQVIAVDEDVDGFTLDDGTYFSGSWKDGYHLWTIQDAKDGDILVDGNFVGIFKENSYNPSDNSGCMYLYCSFDIDNDKFYLESGGYNPTYFYPATKEQRALLFQKMKEAGYELDADKKELKKISQEYPLTPDECIKPAWGEEDNGHVLIISDIIEDKKNEQLYHIGIKVLNNEIAWLKSLKDRVQPQPQKEWSEDDEEKLNQLHKLIVKKAYEEYEIDTEDETLYGKWLKLDNWLNSLKYRVQPKWKPSDEQIEAIRIAGVVGTANDSWAMNILKDMYLQLNGL